MRVYTILILMIFGLVAFSSFTPDGKGGGAPKLKTYFACKQAGNIAMTTQQFLKFINDPLCAKDSLDSIYRVVSFDMVYAETGLYQDSAGLPIIHTDRSYSTFKGDLIDFSWKKVFKQNAYRGDTIIFNNILVKGADKRTYRSSSIEVVLR